MKIKTASGNISINKKSTTCKFMLGYLSTPAFSGASTLAAAMRMNTQLKTMFPSMSAYDRGVLTGFIFVHKPSKAFLKQILGEN